jgi:hypothetical protein
MTTCIRHDHVVAAFQVSSHPWPAQATICDPVQQEDGRLVATVAAIIMDGDAIGIQLAFMPLGHVVFLNYAVLLKVSLAAGKREPSHIQQRLTAGAAKATRCCQRKRGLAADIH